MALWHNERQRFTVAVSVNQLPPGKRLAVFTYLKVYRFGLDFVFSPSTPRLEGWASTPLKISINWWHRPKRSRCSKINRSLRAEGCLGESKAADPSLDSAWAEWLMSEWVWPPAYIWVVERKCCALSQSRQPKVVEERGSRSLFPRRHSAKKSLAKKIKISLWNP